MSMRSTARTAPRFIAMLDVLGCGEAPIKWIGRVGWVKCGSHGFHGPRDLAPLQAGTFLPSGNFLRLTVVH